ncbi:BMP family ABC transporter substrate-binding protein [Polaromonas sp. P1(28)-13]|nr:BMP family ABC transporter substrate-binding protein [Polaromonas sp. P1(28)-13]
MAHGGQNNEACAEVAARFPKVKFVVTQGAVTSTNLASYDVLQEESAYLGGVLTALTTRTGVVGHMSGIRVRPGLKGRAAYAAGVRATNPNVKLLTNFSG